MLGQRIACPGGRMCVCRRVICDHPNSVVTASHVLSIIGCRISNAYFLTKLCVLLGDCLVTPPNSEGDMRSPKLYCNSLPCANILAVESPLPIS